MKKISIRSNRSIVKNKYALVDDELFLFLNKLKWHCDNKGYARYDYSIKGGKGKIISIRLHHVAIGQPLSGYVDHINGDKLDNRKCNLRICSHGQNRMNSKLNKNNTSGYRGLSWKPNRSHWDIYIVSEAKRIYIGCSKDKEEAAYIRDQAALQIQGEFARTDLL